MKNSKLQKHIESTFKKLKNGNTWYARYTSPNYPEYEFFISTKEHGMKGSGHIIILSEEENSQIKDYDEPSAARIEKILFDLDLKVILGENK